MSVPPANHVMVKYHGTVTLMCIVNTIADACLVPNAAACIVKQHMHTQAQDVHTMNQISKCASLLYVPCMSLRSYKASESTLYTWSVGQRCSIYASGPWHTRITVRSGCSTLCEVLQRNLNKIESNVVELEAKLKHEQEKFKTYNKDLKEAEKRYALPT